jgi:hypothetical protein
VFEGIHPAVVKSVDAEKGTVTFDEDRSPAEIAGVIFPLAKNASITIDSRPARLTDLSKGTLVNLTLSVDRRTARVLQVVRP